VTESSITLPANQSDDAGPSKNERVELEMKIMKYRALARAAASDPVTSERISGLIIELKQKLKEIDE
jgi:hypothetical protein